MDSFSQATLRDFIANPKMTTLDNVDEDFSWHFNSDFWWKYAIILLWFVGKKEQIFDVYNENYATLILYVSLLKNRNIVLFFLFF